jgi:hypothetical protein
MPNVAVSRPPQPVRPIRAACVQNAQVGISAAIVARPSGWLTSTFRMAICRDTHNSTPQLETASNVVLPGWAVYGPLKFSKVKRNTKKEAAKWHTIVIVRDSKAPVLDVGQEFFLKAGARLRATPPKKLPRSCANALVPYLPTRDAEALCRILGYFVPQCPD